MSATRIGNAPCSWGVLEFGAFGAEPIGYRQMLDELRQTGYVGTELGDWGFLPTDPAILRSELDRRGLAMIGAFTPVALRDPAAHGPGEALALRTARFLAAVSADADGPRPLVVLADDNDADPIRTRNAGRITPDQSLTDDDWEIFSRGAERIARAVLEQTGLRTAFHHHCGGYVETPAEIDRFLAMTDPALVGLTFDTGHYAYGSGQTDRGMVLEGLERFGSRVQHVHFKDCEPRVAARAREHGWSYLEALQHGLFGELGRGVVEFPDIAAWLRARGYDGWIVVEQDVLPGMGAPRESARRNRDYLASLGL